MKVMVYAIFDKLAEECGPLFTAKNEAVAVRSYRIATRESRRSEHKLLCVGEFDTEKCKLWGCEGIPKEIPVAEEVDPRQLQLPGVDGGGRR